MGKLLWTALGLLLVAGCASAPSGAIIMSGPNLALGGGAGHNRLAEWYAGRSDWPTAVVGYRFSDVTYSYESAYDDQSFYEHEGGSYYFGAESYRQSVLVR